VKLIAKDCSPLNPQPTAAEADWLRRVAASVRAGDFVVPISGDRDDDEPIVYCSWDGTWWAGRYVGSLSFEGRSLIIEPRFGLATLRNWLFEATSVVLTESPGRLRQDESFIAQLLASVWAHGFVEAARHGLPALRRDVATKGPTIRGRLDVTASIRLIASAGREVVSVRSERSLDHAASDAIIAAYGVLRRWLGVPDEQWMPARAKELIPHLMAVTGPRPRVPTKAELDRIRYTPITAGFAPIAELSRQIANRRGLAADVDASGKTKGVLLDVAELWEMYVLSVLRKAATPLTQADTQGERAVVSIEEIVEYLIPYERTANTDRSGFTKRVHASIEKIKKHSILQKIRSSDDRLEISPTLKLLFSAEEIQALTHLYQRMAAGETPAPAIQSEHDEEAEQ
jgi:5-methylcytosine-specific restriction enzyme subunit McrC